MTDPVRDKIPKRSFNKLTLKGQGVLIWFILIPLIAILLVIRLAPSDPARWHVDVPFEADKDMAGGVARVIEGDAETLQQLVSAAQITGARVLAGSVQEGHLTLIARTMWVGFPDYATLQVKDGKVAIWSRLRFGKSDLGVNRARVEGWLRAVQ